MPRPGCFTRRKEMWTVGWVGSRAVLDGCEEKISCAYRSSNREQPSPNCVAITAPILVYCLQLSYEHRGFIVLPPQLLSTVTFSLLWTLDNSGLGNVTYLATLTEVFPCFFLSCKAKAKVKPAKMGHGPHSSIFVLFYVLFILCRSVYCIRVHVHCTTATGWQPSCS